jgi:hypothetical protein
MLSQDDNWNVRYSLVNRCELPAKVARILAKESSAELRRCLAYIGANLPIDIQIKLAKDPDTEVRVALQHANPNVSLEIHRMLVNDSDEGISACASQVLRSGGYYKAFHR